MLSLFAKTELQKLIAETNHRLTVEDFDDVDKLNKLCNAITNNDDPVNDIVDMPVCIGGYELKQPSVGVLEWYNGYFLPLFDTNPLIADAGLAYALTLSDTPAQLWEMKDKRECKKRVKRFLRRLSCTHQELQDALIKLLGVSEESEKDEENKGTAGRLIAMLCREYGHSPDYWLWEAPIGLINTFVADYVARIEAETEAARNATKDAKHKPAPSESRVKKFDALRKHLNVVRDKWQKM